MRQCFPASHLPATARSRFMGTSIERARCCYAMLCHEQVLSVESHSPRSFSGVAPMIRNMRGTIVAPSFAGDHMDTGQGRKFDSP